MNIFFFVFCLLLWNSRFETDKVVLSCLLVLLLIYLFLCWPINERSLLSSHFKVVLFLFVCKVEYKEEYIFEWILLRFSAFRLII